jgi:hypothetical protein
MQDAMTVLHWEVRDLFINAFAYGNVGTERDVVEHLRSGNHLTAGQRAVVAAAFNDALLAIGHPLRV